jgi:copper resistance protein B
MIRQALVVLLVMPYPALAQATDPAATGTDQTPGHAAPPAAAHDLAADRYYDPRAMAVADAAMMGAYGGNSQIRLDLAEYDFRNGRDGYRWEVEAWTGDLDRAVFRSRGEGTAGERLDNGELQAVYGRALDPWWNLQVGLRQDIAPTPVRTYASIGVEGLAPGNLDVLADAFVSDKGQFTARIETTFDERLTRRFVLQPRVELNFAGQDMPLQRLGTGLNTAELGLRLRYEIRRQFAPYVGVSWNWAAGATAGYLRSEGTAPHQRSVVVGVRAWL